MPDAVLLRTERLTRAYGSLLAVSDVDVSVRRGELRSIIGPNGAGKTTFFRLISGETVPTSGRIWFEGTDITECRSTRRHGWASPSRTRSRTSFRT
jgi:ABC-type branched-subunit amino acid transport system ATPase component